MRAKIYSVLKPDAVINRFLLITGMFLLGIWFTASAQQDYKYSGTVLNEFNESLPGVNVIEKGTTKGTMTDDNGRFTLLLANPTADLVFSMMGYISFEKTMKAGEVTEIKLIESMVELEEVMVIGYGTQKRANVTGAISKINGEQITEIPSGTINQALQGRIAGVNISSSSGSPGSGMKVVIRGVGTNGSAQPLYVVDGIRTGYIDNLEPYDIESVEVLKDAASAAIYGADAANGVVLITTKKGSKRAGTVAGTGLITYNMQLGTQSIERYTQPMDDISYTQWMKEAGVKINPSADNTNTDWMDEITNSAFMQRHHIAFNSATEKSSYFISGSYLNQDGVIGGDKSNFERITLRTNIAQQVKPWLQVGTNITYSHFDRSALGEDDEFGGIVSSGLMMDPMTPTLFEGDLPGFAQDALDAGYTLVQNEDEEYYGVSNNVLGEIANPLAKMEISKGYTKEDKIMGNIFATFGGEVWKGFSFTTRLSNDVANQLYHTWYPTYWFSSENMNTQANVRDNYNNWSTWLWENFATYDNTFAEKHHVNAIAGTSAQQYQHKYLTTLSGPMFAEDDDFAEHGDVVVDGQLSGNHDLNRLVSYYGRLSYEYGGRYLLNFILRRDGTSLLGSESRWGNFPSVSAGWIVSGENFWNVDLINFFKIRASWGQNGMLSGLGPDQFRALITTSGIKYPKPGGGYYTGAEPDLLANPELKWATSEQIDIGFDMYMWDNRVTFGFDYFNKKTRDLLTPGTPPPSVGNDAPFVNAGDVLNKGIELEAGLRNYESDFQYDVNLNFTYMTNKVTYLNPLLDRVSGAGLGTGWTVTWFELDQPVWYFRGYQTDGIFQNQAQINAYKEANGGLSGYNPKPGDPIVVNANGDKLINSEDQVYIGDPHPNILWGAMVNLRYFGFDLNVFFQGVHGHDVLLGWNRYDRSTSNRPQFWYDDRWTGEGSTNERPRPEMSSPYVYNSDLLIYKGDYMRVKQIQLGYTLPKSLLGKMKFQDLRLYVSLEDYFTITSYPGMDPSAGTGRDNSQGIDRGMYPPARKLLFGLSFSL
ncbi:MAG TPA: TonB-dependent receptor [Bacteroidales bacterium]|nr:TonB-dependent receptor [Bacteroidales bacterium]